MAEHGVTAVRKAGRMLVRLILVAAVLAAAGFIGGNLYLRWRQESLTSFIGKQIITIVNGQLVPTISFDDLVYTPPLSVSLGNAKLTAPDGTEVFTIERLDIKLVEVPTTSKAIMIESVTFTTPTLNLIQSPGGGIRGLDPFVKPKAQRDAPENQAEGSDNLSDVLKLDKIIITDASVVYRDSDDSDPWVFDDLSTTLDIDENPKMPGWYDFSLVTGVEPGLEIESNGQFNLDTLVIELIKLSLKLTINDETIASLPPHLKAACKEHTIRGTLTGDANGRLVLGSIEKSKLEAHLKLDETYVSFDEFQIPTDIIAAGLYYDNGLFSFRSSEAKLLGGEAEFAIGFERTRLDGAQPDGNAGGRTARTTPETALGEDANNAAGNQSVNEAISGVERRLAGRFILREIELEQLLLQPGTEEKPSKLAGKLSGILNLRMTKLKEANLEEMVRSIEGDGTLQLRKGRLWQVPFFSAAANLLDISMIIRPGSEGGTRGDAAFTLDDDAVTITKLRIVSSLYAVDAKGRINYDGTLKGSMNAGLIEKINHTLGPIGKLFGALTDNLVKYTIGGTLAKPKFGTRVLGIGG